MDDTQFADIAAWISNAGLSGQDETAMVTEFCNRLVALGLPLARAQLFIDTLHPVHAGLVSPSRVKRWSDGGAARSIT